MTLVCPRCGNFFHPKDN
ncbi:hypothetical protein [Yersinia pestis]|nr:hypothetical protein [Yersinia pestis]